MLDRKKRNKINMYKKFDQKCGKVDKNVEKPEFSTISTFPHSKLYRFLHSEKYCKIKENGIEKPQNKIIYPHLIHKMWINDRWIRV